MKEPMSDEKKRNNGQKEQRTESGGVRRASQFIMEIKVTALSQWNE